MDEDVWRAKRTERLNQRKEIMPDSHAHLPRTVARVVNAIRLSIRDGLSVRRVFPTADLPDFDPFIFFDETESDDSSLAVGSNPSRTGEETETVAYRFGPRHRVQLCMRMACNQRTRLSPSQEIFAEELPREEMGDCHATARVIAGEAAGVSGAIKIASPLLFLHFVLEPGGHLMQPVSLEYNVLSYVLTGTGRFGPDECQACTRQAIFFNEYGHLVSISNLETNREPLSVLLIGGIPLREHAHL
jgi:quercetin 2,3-dioxygenase